MKNYLLHFLSFAILTSLLYAGGGHSHHVLVRPDGTMWAWGSNDFGQLGTGNNAPSSNPIEIGSGNTWVEVSRGQFHNIALDDFGRVWVWGSNGDGQLGLGHNFDTEAPTLVNGVEGIDDIAAGAYHSLAVSKSGNIFAWGRNKSGQLGNGNNTNSNMPVMLSIGPVKEVKAVAEHNLALLNNGMLYAWGSNGYGQLGDGTGTSSNIPIQIGGDTDWDSISSGLYHSLAIKISGNAYTWGKNYNGQLGKGDTNDVNTVSPSGPGILSASSGAKHTLLLSNASFVGVMGSNIFNQAGGGSEKDNVLNPNPVVFGDWTSVDAGEYHNVIESGNGEIYSFGRNNRGQAGVGYLNNSNPLTNIFGPMSRFKNEYSMQFDGVDDRVDFGDIHGFERTDTFSLSCWFKTDQSTGTLFSKMLTGAGYLLQVNLGNIYFQLRNASGGTSHLQIVTVNSFADNEWHHIVLSYDGSSSAAGTNIIIDGIIQPFNINFDTLSSSTLNGASLLIGAFDNGAGGPYLGFSEEHSIWNIQLNQSNAQEIYNLGNGSDLSQTSMSANLIGWWRMGDGGTYPTVKDHSGQGNDGTMTNMTGNALVPTYPNFNKNAVSFDGVDDTVNNGNLLNFEISDKFSVSTRLKVGDTAASESIINKLSPDAALKGYEIIIDINGNLFWALIENASTTNYIQIKTDTGGYDDGQWHDVVATYNGNSSVSGLELYVDGVLQSSTTVVDNSTSTISNSGNLIFGGRTSNYFSGSLDEVSIWNKELTATEVSAIYAGNTQIDLKKTSMSSNLVGWWRMGDGDTYPAIKDHSMNSNDSTMVNGPQITNIGKNYMLVDISSGPSGNSYPVTYTDTMPDLTGAGNLTYKGNVIVLKYIPAGMFTMGNATLGSNAEHKVTLTKGYYAGVFELTQRQWLNVMSSFPLGDGTQDFNNSGNTLPVQKISWEDIRGASGTYDWPNTKTVASNTFMGNLQAKTGLTFDLPTEAEWEYACRAGTSTPWPYGSVFNNSYAWTNVNSSGITHEVGSLLPNQWGLFDMHGNLNEMCLDWYVTPYSPGGDQINPEGPVSGSTRTKRGGNYSFNTDGTQSAKRYSLTFGLRAIDNGFRLFMKP